VVGSVLGLLIIPLLYIYVQTVREAVKRQLFGVDRVDPDSKPPAAAAAD